MAECYRPDYNPDLLNLNIALELQSMSVPTRYVHDIRACLHIGAGDG